MRVSQVHQVQLAAQNNALWCDHVCRAHGVPGEFFPTVWLNRRVPPPYHSNLVVMADSGSQNATLEHIQDLMRLPLAAHWSAKDSFCNLELEGLGFALLFEASWIWREPGVGNAHGVSADARWSRLTSSLDLARWEASWAGNAGNAEARNTPAQFPGSLLADPEHAFFAGSAGNEIIAGGIANRTGSVVGLSNIFVNSGDVIAVWTELINRAGHAFPGLPLVGYERGSALEAALACGFKVIGPLRVWARRD